MQPVWNNLLMHHHVVNSLYDKNVFMVYKKRHRKLD
uniref:DNA repair protein complementing XP-C cells homolog isoform X2 n=1 Tax=Rhizophora mucronata TaxID=61149 RepID=A0A2P2LPV1_RHIMU